MNAQKIIVKMEGNKLRISIDPTPFIIAAAYFNIFLLCAFYALRWLP